MFCPKRTIAKFTVSLETLRMLHQSRSKLKANWNLRFQWWIRASSIFIFYSIWTLLFRLLVISFITFFLIPLSSQLEWLGINHHWFEGDERLPRFEEISDIFSANELPLIGVSSLLFIVFLHLLNPLISVSTREFFSLKKFKQLYPSGALHGLVFAIALIFVFLFSGFYRFLGFYIQFDDLILSLPNLLIRISAIGLLIYCEEFLFRNRLLNHLRQGFQTLQTHLHLKKATASTSRLRPELTAMIITSLAYCIIKWLQFDLGVMHTITLFLISMLLCIKALDSASEPNSFFMHGAGFLTALLVIFHVFFSLPIFGNDYSGIIILKYYAGPDTEDAVERSTIRFLTGGAGGPFSSLAFQILLGIEVLRSLWIQKKFLLKNNS